jgi:hypothetical protein
VGKEFCSKPELGRLKCSGRIPIVFKTSLREAGIDPGSIAAVVCSHPHPDHIGGICTDDGVPQFSNAQIYLSENDFNIWTDKELLGTRLDLWVKIARNNLLPVRERSYSSKTGRSFCPAYRPCSLLVTQKSMLASS